MQSLILASNNRLPRDKDRSIVDEKQALQTQWPENVEPPFMKVLRIINNIAKDIEKSLEGKSVTRFDRQHSHSLAIRIQEMIKEVTDECENGYSFGDHEISFWLRFAMPIEDVPEALRKTRDWHIEAHELEDHG